MPAVVLVAALACGQPDARATKDREGARPDTSGTLSATAQALAPADTSDATPDVPPPPEAPARTTEQRLLRDLIDVHEAISWIVHDRMSTRHDDHEMANAVAAMSNDPAKNVGRLDIDIDREKDELLARLKSAFGDEHRPKLPARAARRADSLARVNKATGDSAYRAQLSSLLRRELAVIDSARPFLHDAATRTLALRHRAEARQRLALFTSPAAPAAH